MITIDFKGGLGNKMFMYAAAHVLSKKHKMQITTDLLEYPHYIHNESEKCNFKEDLIVNNKNFISVYEQNKIEYNLKMCDFFQTCEIVKKFKDDFKQCFSLNLKPINGTIIHYRLGDLITHRPDAITKLVYFEKCINYINNSKNMYITTDSPDDENVQYLIEKYKIKLIDIKRADTIKFSSRFTNKILSTGTFSWWIGLLGNQKSNVFCPIPTEYGKWHGDIFVFEEWKYVSFYPNRNY